jgi:hypothetical protein
MCSTGKVSILTTELATETRRTGFVLPADTDIMRISQAELDSSEEFYEIPGFGLVTDKKTVIGLPFSILGVTFQKPVKDKANEYGERDYVTLRCVVHDAAHIADALRRGLIPSGEAAYDPEERIVINDGSTGIRRQIVKMLHSAKLIDIGAIESEFSYDKPWTQWESFSQSEFQGEDEVPGFTKNHNGNQLHIKARRGLRASVYSNEYAEDAVTFYL